MQEFCDSSQLSRVLWRLFVNLISYSIVDYACKIVIHTIFITFDAKAKLSDCMHKHLFYSSLLLGD